jgi:hypothetical protein
MSKDIALTERLAGLSHLVVAPEAPRVCRTIAREIQDELAPNARLARPATPTPPDARPLEITVKEPACRAPRAARVWFHVNRPGHATLGATHARYLYAWFRYLVEVRGDAPVSAVSERRGIRPVFQWQRPVFDLYFTQSGRTVRDLDPEDYVRQMARSGFTHLEVNGLDFPEPFEPGVPGEIYPRFYTYCAALDQFVASFLNRGIYPKDYLQANLRRLKENARLAARYGLVPVLLCFEPRSVPETLLEKYPELRGARVDHPFRSFKPRYNLAVAHPVVQRHYRELIQKLVRAVPELGCLAIWTNDSGAGLEFTRSLYAGANGSAYLVREWSEEDVFARSAAASAAGFLRLLRESAAEINPGFRVTTRLEPFGPERPYLLAALGRGLDVETPTLLATGWESPYRHPRYADSEIGPFTIFNNRFLPEERDPMRRLARRGCRTHVMYAHGPVNNFEPLLGIPAPWLTHEKLAALREVGVDHLAHLGGVAPPAAVPWNANEEVFRRFQFDPDADVDTVVSAVARDWARADCGAALLRAWRQVDRAIRGFMPNPLYFSWGVWYRLWVRPLVPDIEAIPEGERAYYEAHLLSTHHNPTRVDLSRDVLFHLMDAATARRTVTRIDRHALPPLDRALAILEADADHPLLLDQRDRVEALRCWCATRRSVAAWIANVHGYLETRNAKTRAACRRRLDEMVRSEIANAERLLALRRRSQVSFMALSADRETTFIYDGSFDRHLERKIRLMRKYGDRRPRIDEEILWRVKGLGAKTR